MIFASGSDIRAGWPGRSDSRLAGSGGRAAARCGLAVDLVVARAGCLRSGRCGCERGEGLAAAPAGFRGKAGGGAALVFLLPGVP